MSALLKALNSKKKVRVIPGLFLLGGAAICLALPASAQSNRDINNRISRLENEIETLSRALYKGETPPAGAFGGGGDAANTEVRLQQLETDLRDLRGLIEQQGNDVHQMKEQMDRALSDMELRIGAVEGNGGGAVSSPMNSGGGYTAGSMGSSPSPASQPSYNGGANTTPYANSSYQTPPQPVAPEPTDEQRFQWSSSQNNGAGGNLGTLSTYGKTGSDKAASLYEDAFAALKSNQYDQAEKGFQDFIAQNPGHALVSNAKYWLGETYYVRGKFEEAAKVFAEGYQLAPKGSKAADNLLKLGMSLAGMGNTQDACTALAQIKKDFPSGSAPVLRRADQEVERLGCV